MESRGQAAAMCSSAGWGRRLPAAIAAAAARLKRRPTPRPHCTRRAAPARCRGPSWLARTTCSCSCQCTTAGCSWPPERRPSTGASGPAAGARARHTARCALCAPCLRPQGPKPQAGAAAQLAHPSGTLHTSPAGAARCCWLGRGHRGAAAAPARPPTPSKSRRPAGGSKGRAAGLMRPAACRELGQGVPAGLPASGGNHCRALRRCPPGCAAATGAPAWPGPGLK